MNKELLPLPKCKQEAKCKQESPGHNPVPCVLGWPCSSREAGSDDSLWFFPTIPILWFCEMQLPNVHSTAKVKSFSTVLAHQIIFQLKFPKERWKAGVYLLQPQSFHRYMELFTSTTLERDFQFQACQNKENHASFVTEENITSNSPLWSLHVHTLMSKTCWFSSLNTVNLFRHTTFIKTVL